jgi:hypothetical protein
MFKSFVNKAAAIFAQKAAELNFTRITEDRYDTYGISQVLHKQSVEESAEWAKQYVHSSLFFSDKRRLYAFVAKELKKFEGNSELLFLEFGVQTGTSINFFSSKLSNTFFGFDTFEGMPEEWAGWNVEKGQFTMNGQFPKVNSNVTLTKGLIQDTLPVFLDERKDKKIGFIHIDTDTYTPAKIVLQLCKSRLVPGSLILFDELHSYTSWKQHELKALHEELDESQYTYKAFSDRKQALIEML